MAFLALHRVQKYRITLPYSPALCVTPSNPAVPQFEFPYRVYETVQKRVLLQSEDWARAVPPIGGSCSDSSRVFSSLRITM